MALVGKPVLSLVLELFLALALSLVLALFLALELFLVLALSLALLLLDQVLLLQLVLIHDLDSQLPSLAQVVHVFQKQQLALLDLELPVGALLYSPALGQVQLVFVECWFLVKETMLHHILVKLIIFDF